ncbi:hypothetical protein LCGC14_0745780 [marine sediment metagenome]|uniref:Urease accessory protein UreH-like transmembrane domain-containing protein n=1 Tax=marine sediment metagenome TaxID=412755 RepID=A0A0F9Q9L6_9ZZZZ
MYFSKSFKRSVPINNSVEEPGTINNNNVEMNNENQDEYAYKYEGFSGSFMLGFSLGYAWIGCNTPIYISIILTVSSQTDFWLGILVFFIFGLGIMIPFMILGAGLGFLRKRFLVKLIKVGAKIQKIFAIIMFYIGIEILLSAYGIIGLIPFI